jgi:hypothetical protein
MNLLIYFDTFVIEKLEPWTCKVHFRGMPFLVIWDPKTFTTFLGHQATIIGVKILKMRFQPYDIVLFVESFLMVKRSLELMRKLCLSQVYI